MQNFHELLRATLERGVDQFNVRTNSLCRVLVGYQLQYDLADGFPAITTKKLAFNNMKGELLGFFRGYDNAADFRKLGCTVWDKNANETVAWLANPNRKGTDDLGRIYGKQWTDWKDRRVAGTVLERDALLARGYAQKMHDSDQGLWLVERGINQLENALHTIITNPSDRRVIVSGWNPTEFDQMALPPCHMDYRFVAFETTKVLHVVMTIRSWDLFLGAPFNIASTSLFLAIMARLAGYTPGTVTIQATNAHIYGDHFEQTREMLEREHFAPPQLVLSENVRPISDPADIAGAFARIEPEDVWLSNYSSHAAIAATMAA
ncbi:MAG: thymidylate synthase [Casimicrobium sp.]